MEFNEKLQDLRKQKGLTQEELAERLYVSRTAVSKWESGRGYPSIESLKAIAAFFSVSVDALLSGEEVLTLAEEDGRRKERRIVNLVFGLLDCSALLLLFLPFFGQTVNGVVQGVSLLHLTETALYQRMIFFACIIGMALIGGVTLLLRNRNHGIWQHNKPSFLLNGVGLLLFIVSLQPYVAVFLLVLLAIKISLLIKWR